MIAVIADDFTGAAELGGIGLQFDLAVEISTEVNLQSKADLIIISADTRSLSKKDAVDRMVNVTKKIAELKPDFIFKKVDSVLRGHVTDELTAQMKALNVEKVLLVPANPASGRTIANGVYLLNSVPIHLSSFGEDPEYAISSSNVMDMLRVDPGNVTIAKNIESIPRSGIVLGEATTVQELNIWASCVDNQALVAGAAAFFRALLEHIYPARNANLKFQSVGFETPALYISGTTFNKSRQAIKKLKSDGGPVVYLSKEVLSSPTFPGADSDVSINKVISLLSANGKVILAIDEDSTKGMQYDAASLREKTAAAVEQIFQKTDIRELIIEGGATASSICRQLKFHRFVPVMEIMPGVVKMKVMEKNKLFLTVKPGSYEWPPAIWNIYSNM